MNQNLINNMDNKTVAVPPKKAYQSPCFIKLGLLKELTQGGGPGIEVDVWNTPSERGSIEAKF